ncbi:MAG TPA: hypothetical protein VH063_12565 [Gaiellaceae bacterium]|nr:hypothetical protein [Gaiellaceae bacterium]
MTGSQVLTRAGLFRVGAVAAIGAGVAPHGEALAGLAIPASVTPAAPGPDYLRPEPYRSLVGHAFRTERDGMGPVELRLLQVRVLPGGGDAFSLLFRGGTNVKLESATHRIDHDSLGRFELFLNPVGRPAAGLTVEALVNRTASRGGSHG